MKKDAFNALRLHYRKLLIISLLAAFTACEEDYQPKPQGYFRIGLPGTNYDTLSSSCPYTFMVNTEAVFKPKKQCWADIYYPKLHATLQLTYKNLEEQKDPNQLFVEAQKLAYEHTVVAQGIGEKLYTDADNRVFGIYYEMQGNAASSAQFYVTDSTKNFLRGVLYFYSAPNADSLKPANAYMQNEMVKLIESIRWQN